MGNLILLRHAKSDWTTDAPTDYERPLNERGQRNAARMADWIATDYSSCEGEGTCGLTQSTRAVMCADVNGMRVNDTSCDPESVPELVKDCDNEQEVKKWV